MPYRSRSPQRGADQHFATKGRPGSHGAVASSYTLAHAGHQVRLGPVAFWTTVGALVIMAVWSMGTAGYFAFRDDLLTRLIARQADMQYAYEDRIAELRGQVDRLTSRQLLDQEQVEQKMDQLVRRQSVLESRAAAISSLPDPSPTGSTKPALRPQPRSDNSTTPKPSPINDTVILTAPTDRESNLESRAPRTRTARTGTSKVAGLPATLARIEEALDRLEARQGATLVAIEESFETKARRMRGILADLGVDVSKAASAGGAGPVGGPFVPLTKRNDAGGFERQLHRIQLARTNVERLSRTMLAVPIRRPLAGELEMSSGFGVRLDPFVRAPAMHTGLDFRSSTGESVRATAAGKVTIAGWNGGYGRLVEIDHGNGFATRYGHLSEILVTEDQLIRPGQIIGRVGSTGRSTGPHLHYETRIDGDAVDPHKFLRAGLRLGEKS
jgi:murein DD-endopeptidase MepM/ murein hydrolase activator NlpD